MSVGSISDLSIEIADPAIQSDPVEAVRRTIAREFAAAPRHAVVTVGTFDGMHAGHRAVLAAAVDQARMLGVPVVAVTFDPRPEVVLRSGALPDLCCSVTERVALIRAAGSDHVIVLPFTRVLAALDDIEFISLMQKSLQPSLLVVGEEFTLGRGGSGTVTRINALGVPTHGVVLVRGADGVKVSSTAIRLARAATRSS